ncbi:MAG: NPCBM/NEW2 domain-containing protein [Mariniphaga sp.]
MNRIFSLIIVFIIFTVSCTHNSTSIWLDDLKIKTFSEGIPSVSAKKNQAGDSIFIAGKYFERGIGVQSVSVLSFLLNGKAEQFSAMVGADDKGNTKMKVQFYVLGDQKILFESGNMKVGDAPKIVTVNLSGIQRMGLLVTVSLEDEGYGKTYSNWADAKIVMQEGNTPLNIPNNDEKYILTPPPPKTPKINSAKIVGATPGKPFLYSIAVTGERPISFSAKNLPNGLSLDEKTGIISGKVTKRGSYSPTLLAKNALGEDSKQLKIVIGDTIALTPPIGWNGWNSWARNIDGEKVIASANAMVKMGLSNHGWNYINIDDAWQGQRGGKFNAIQPNEKFPKFKEMIDEIHSKGLKLGVYSTPWISSYAGYAGASSDFEKGEYPDSVKNNKRAYRRIGKYRFEMEDARQMAEWGVDYLKYDWRIETNSAMRMSEVLKKSGRDILFSISNSAPFANARDWMKLANTWRTGPDIRDSWLSLFTSAFTIDKWAPFGGPGHWNDPDMLILGNVTTGTDLHPTRLTPDEQYSHVSLFSLLAAPLLIGCPVEQLDAFTLNLLTNDEVIEINQDPLGKPARLVSDENGVQIWLRPLEDGSFAVGLFYTDDYGKTPQSYFRWENEPVKLYIFGFEKVGLKGSWKIRDVWRQKDLGEFDKTFGSEIPHHGVKMLRMVPK